MSASRACEFWVGFMDQPQLLTSDPNLNMPAWQKAVRFPNLSLVCGPSQLPLKNRSLFTHLLVVGIGLFAFKEYLRSKIGLDAGIRCLQIERD